MNFLTYDEVEKGDSIYYFLPGVSWQTTQAVVLDKQPPNAITIYEQGKLHVRSREWFDSSSFLPVTDELMAEEPPR